MPARSNQARHFWWVIFENSECQVNMILQVLNGALDPIWRREEVKGEVWGFADVWVCLSLQVELNMHF